MMPLTMKLVVFVISMLILQPAIATEKSSSLHTYIVHVEPLNNQLLDAYGRSLDLGSWYLSFLPTTLVNSNKGNEVPHIVYSYRNVFSGFAAKLTSEQVKEMEKKKGFISALPQQMLSLHTTHSPSFLGLHENMGLWKDSSYGKGVIIGVLDTGIQTDHPSFNDQGMPRPPAKWKGECEEGFMCNNKIIGVRNFESSEGTAFDLEGHGTHTASTAAGNFVKGANLFGSANGTAVGVAPRVHLAIYKVCSIIGCLDSDVLAAMDAAIDDGVDVLSMSVGGFFGPFHKNYIAIGAFTAMEKGIFVSSSAGNSGPFTSSVTNEAPWILTVGASTTDRKLKATVVLGDKQEIDGETVFQPKNFSSTKQLALAFPGLKTRYLNVAYCTPRSLDRAKVKGKIVLCVVGGEPSEKSKEVKRVGGAAMILLNTERQGFTISANTHVLPTTNVDFEGTRKIIAYITSASKPKATIVFKGTTFGDKHAPMVASFSSRGPSLQSPGILKPDIIGPGVNILAAWPFSIENNTNTKFTFNIISGTSMSCPHLSGVAALLKSRHPNWSPAAIKSAIMTTADIVNLNNTLIEDEPLVPADIFVTGAGHVNPSKANDPGLIYDIASQDYISYLCGLNYTNRQVGFISQRIVNCTKETRTPEAQLNYPSFSITFGSPPQRYTRTVTNVGEARVTYIVQIVPPMGVDVIVKPRKLTFSNLNQKLKYEVTFSRSDTASNATFSHGYLLWKSSKYSVRNPIAVF